MSASLIHGEKTVIVPPGSSSAYSPFPVGNAFANFPAVATKRIIAQYTDPRTSSSSTHGEHRIASRRQKVEENISSSLKSKTEPRYIGENHECFELDAVAAFREEFGIKLDGNPWKNFKRLLCGCQDLPFIILQNPTNKHESEYEEMKLCPTIQWISDMLGEIGLALEDVVIMDVCSLFSDDDLKRMGKDSQHTWDAVEKSYAMVEDILEFLNPSMVLSCQCATRGQRKRIDGRVKTTWEPADNTLARTLCSSQKDVTRGVTKEIKIGSNSTLCVHGVHPRRLMFKEGTRMIPELRGAFKDVFVPCMRWFRRGEKTTTAPSAVGVRSLQHVNLVIRTKADSLSAKTAIQVAVNEVGEEFGKLGEQLSAPKLSS